jgi:hypothetical protein
MENFAVNSILSLYRLYKMTSPIAQRREKSGHFWETTSPKSPSSESPGLSQQSHDDAKIFRSRSHLSLLCPFCTCNFNSDKVPKGNISVQLNTNLVRFEPGKYLSHWGNNYNLWSALQEKVLISIKLKKKCSP